MPLLERSRVVEMERRQDTTSASPSPSAAASSGSSMSTGTIVAIVLATTAFVILGVLMLLNQRRKRLAQKDPQAKGKQQGLFARWRSNSNRGAYSSQLQPAPIQAHVSQDRLSRRGSGDVEMEMSGNAPATTAAAQPAQPDAAAGGVDRNTSVRSVMTLPPYSISARPTEQVLGREGERAGVDRVVEQPENVDETEERRDDEMESLYQIRQARRQEAAEREDRRRQRREARARGDTVTLARLQAEHRARQESNASGVSLSQQLIAEHQGKNRDRRVSSVQYFDVGVARHDGTRVRAPSMESSDSTPLLESAATFGNMPTTPGSAGFEPPRPPFANSARGSRSSIASVVSSLHAGSVVSPGNDMDSISLHPTRSRTHFPQGAFATSHHTLPNPTIEPPTYDHAELGEAPPYESPVAGRGEGPYRHLAGVTSLPAIEISSATSAAGSSPRSPQGRSLTRPQ